MTADTLTRPLTESECALVAQYHKLIYCVIEDCHLPMMRQQMPMAKLLWG